jgi:hypothetical protein
MADDREEAWGALHEALPARWRLGPPTYSPADRAWLVTAREPHPGRGKHPQTVTGTGEDEIAALRDLDDRLRGIPRPDGGQMDALRRRLRLAYIAGAEEWTRGELGRGMTDAELKRVTARFSGSTGQMTS